MPGLPERINTTSKDSNGGEISDTKSLSVPTSNHNRPHHGLTYDQLDKFWCGLTLPDRQELLKINRQTLLEHARKKPYCSRCNGLLLEGFYQILMYQKSAKPDIPGDDYPEQATDSLDESNLCAENGCQDAVYDPSVHPWGGLTIARDESLTLLDCYLCSKSLKEVQNVFDGAHAREREREFLYPDACGGSSRGWMVQVTAGHGRPHISRETCALHTARLPVNTLVDFWSAIGDETQYSLMRMKEEDFIERLVYRFENKRFCRDCRRNVIREFKELKELRRMRKEPRCTAWFCAADTDFQYEVSHDTVRVDWNQTFSGASFGAYHHFEWAVGTGEGKSDILEFEDVGLSVRVQVNGLDLSELIVCYITLRGWKNNGRCNEICVKAQALQGQYCVHNRLLVGDGYVTMTKGESIESFFEHAEEVEEEEDDDSMDKDGNDFDSECSRPQKHAKSPELAREFLLDAATVIFKEQISKAFREGTTRQNAHIVFVSLALQLLEERLHVACKEIISLENQMKLLEEEEKEKLKEEKLRERQERKRNKEREKKLRKKERLKEKENNSVDSKIDTAVTDASVKIATCCPDDSPDFSRTSGSICETGETTQASPFSPDVQDDELLRELVYSKMEDHAEDSSGRKFDNTGDWNSSFSYDDHKYSRRNTKYHKDPQPEWLKCSSGRRKGYTDDFESTRSTIGSNKQLMSSAMKSNTRIGGQKIGQYCQCPVSEYDSHNCRCYYYKDHKPRPASGTRAVQEPKYGNKLEATLDVSNPYYRGNKYAQGSCAREVGNQSRGKISGGSPAHGKKVWEPLGSQKKYVRRVSDSDFTLKCTPEVEASEAKKLRGISNATGNEVADISVPNKHLDDDILTETAGIGLHELTKSQNFSRKAVSENGERTLGSSTSSSSNSDNCSSCLGEGDSNTQNLEASDSEESCQNSDGKEIDRFTECVRVTEDSTTASGMDAAKIQEQACAKTVLNPNVAPFCGNVGNINSSAPPLQMHNESVHYPVFQVPTFGYYPPSPVSWPVGPANGLFSFPQTGHYLYPDGSGYALNGNPQLMQYGTLQHLAPPLLNTAHAPIYQPVAQIGDVGEPKEVECESANVASTSQLPGPFTVLNAARNQKPQNMDEGGENGFSLFHFGGPVALTSGYEAGPVSLKGGYISPKKDSIEEYNLFDASNGIKFSFF